MYVVAIKHPNCDKVYLYEVPAAASLNKGNRVIVKNTYGEVEGVCMCDAVYANDADLALIRALLRLDPDKPLAKVVAKLQAIRYD